MVERRRAREITRIEALSDGVFAFAATLLIVTLDPPRSFEAMHDRLPELIPFALGFGGLVLVWYVQNEFFRRTGVQDKLTVLLNACLLFTVLFFVQPLRLLSQAFAAEFLGVEGPAGGGIHGADQLAKLFEIYGAGFCVIFLCIALLYRHAARPGVVESLDAEARSELRYYARHFGLYVVVGLVSIAAAAAGVGLRYGVPGWLYGLMGPAEGLHRVWCRRRGLVTGS